MDMGKPTSKILVNQAEVLVSQRSLQCASQWSTATSSFSARIEHPPNVAAIPGNVPCILLVMTFNSSNIHHKTQLLRRKLQEWPKRASPMCLKAPSFKSRALTAVTSLFLVQNRALRIPGVDP